MQVTQVTQVTQADISDYVAGRLDEADRQRVGAMIKCSYSLRRAAAELQKLRSSVERNLSAHQGISAHQGMRMGQ